MKVLSIDVIGESCRISTSGISINELVEISRQTNSRIYYQAGGESLAYRLEKEFEYGGFKIGHAIGFWFNSEFQTFWSR